MKQADNLSQSSWFVSKSYDTFLLAGFPTAFIIIFLVSFLHRYLSQPKAYDYLYTVFIFPHFIAGISIVYLYQKEWKKKPFEFLLLPLIFIGSSMFLIPLTNYKPRIFRYIWGGLHMFTQDYYIIGLYKLKNNDLLKLDKIIDTAFLIGLRSDYLIRGSFTFIMKYWSPISQLTVIAFLLRQVYLFFRYKKIHPFKVLFFSAIFICHYYLLFFAIPHRPILTRISLAYSGQICLHSF